MLAKSTLVAVIFGLASAPSLATEPKAGDASKLDIQLKDVKKQPTLVVKKSVKRDEIGPSLAEIFPKVFAHLGKSGIQPKTAPLAKYKVDGDKFEMEGGIVVPEGTKGEGALVASDLPAGKVAFAVHVGPYEKLPDTYEALKAWLKTKGLKPSDIGWEIYISDPGSTKPEEIKTEVYLLVEPEKKK